MAIVEPSAQDPGAYKPPRFNLATREALWGYAFISVWIVGFLLFTLIPMIATFVFTFTNINLIQEEPLRFVGLANYQHLFTDPRTWDSLGVTFRFALFAIPIGLLMLPFSLALLLNSKSLRGSRYLPGALLHAVRDPLRGGALRCGGMLNPEAGWINGVLSAIGIQGPDWLNDPTWIYPSLVLIGLWGIGSAHHHQHRGPAERADRAVRRRAGRWRRLVGPAAPRDDPADVPRPLLQRSCSARSASCSTSWSRSS